MSSARERLGVRTWLAIALLAVVPAGCGGTTTESTVACRERASREVHGAFPRGVGGTEVTDDARRYVEVTYCAPFAERGWVYEDGTLSIAAHSWLVEGSSEECASAGVATSAQTVPCEQLDSTGGTQVIHCAILHRVRRSEVRDYVEQLERTHEVECDDGTPLEQLGAPG